MRLHASIKQTERHIAIDKDSVLFANKMRGRKGIYSDRLQYKCM